MFIFALCINIAVGASAAIAARRVIPYEEAHKSTALGAVLLLQLLGMLPIVGYFLFLKTEWSLMYLVAGSELPVRPWVLLVALPITALASFLVARNLIIRGQTWQPWLLVGAGGALSFLLLWLGQRQLFYLTTSAGFDRSELGVSLASEPTGLIVMLGLLVILSTWAFSMIRLRAYAHACSAGSSEMPAFVVEDELEGTILSPERVGKKKK